MSGPGWHRRVEIRDGGRTVALADVTTSENDEMTAQASLRAAAGHITPGTRANLVDTVMDLPEVRERSRLKAALPIGDCETLARLRERCCEVATRAAGASALFEADIPRPGGAGPAAGPA